MRKTLSICALAIIATCAQGQGKLHTFSFTPQVGIALGKQKGFTANTMQLNNLTSTVSNGLYYQPTARYKTGITAGIEVSYQLTNKLAFSLGTFYTEAGSKYKDFDEVFGSQQQENTASSTAEEGTLHGVSCTNQHNTFGYIAVPLMAHYYVAKDFALKCGIEIGFLTTVNQEWDQAEFTYNKVSNITTFDTPTSHKISLKDKAKSTILSIPVGASYEYEHVVLDARYHISLTNSMKNIDTHNRLFTMTVGYRF